MNWKLSVIIPVYNGEKYLQKCVESVQKQTLRELEIILVDDGSTDQSGAICDELARKDSRIRVLHQSNAGVSAARNAGIVAAKGEYLGFVDADDSIVPEMYASLLQIAQETDSDIVMCDATTVYTNGRTEPDTITQLPESRIIKNNDWTPQLLMEMAGSAWRCIYRYTDKLRNHTVAFPLGVKFSEDRIFNILAVGYANQIAYVKTSYYNRLVHDASCVMSFHADYFERVKLAHEGTVKALCEAWNDDQTYQTAYLAQFIGGAIGAINNYWYRTSTLTKRERLEKVRALCEDAELRGAITKAGRNDLRTKLILGNNAMLLSMIAIMLNKKHGR